MQSTTAAALRWRSRMTASRDAIDSALTNDAPINEADAAPRSRNAPSWQRTVSSLHGMMQQALQHPILLYLQSRWPAHWSVRPEHGPVISLFLLLVGDWSMCLWSLHQTHTWWRTTCVTIQVLVGVVVAVQQWVLSTVPTDPVSRDDWVHEWNTLQRLQLQLTRSEPLLDRVYEIERQLGTNHGPDNMAQLIRTAAEWRRVQDMWCRTLARRVAMHLWTAWLETSRSAVDHESLGILDHWVRLVATDADTARVTIHRKSVLDPWWTTTHAAPESEPLIAMTASSPTVTWRVVALLEQLSTVQSSWEPPAKATSTRSRSHRTLPPVSTWITFGTLQGSGQALNNTLDLLQLSNVPLKHV